MEDADRLSDRAIARELEVSQPFVSALRRQCGLARRDHQLDAEGDFTPRPTGDLDVLGSAIPSAEATERASEQDTCGNFRGHWGASWFVRWVPWRAEEDNSHARTDEDDPFA